MLLLAITINYVQLLFFDNTWIYDIIVKVQKVCKAYAKFLNISKVAGPFMV